jgi:hypothetical protein
VVTISTPEKVEAAPPPEKPEKPKGALTHQVDIAFGQETNKTALPTKAGLNIFCPRPPNISFPRKIAAPPPTRGNQKGAEGGRDKPRSKPVITALPSVIERGFLKILQLRASNPIVLPTDKRIVNKVEETPKK